MKKKKLSATKAKKSRAQEVISHLQGTLALLDNKNVRPDLQWRRYEELLSLTQIMSSSIDYKKMYKMAVGKIKELMDVEAVVIYRTDKSRKELVIEAGLTDFAEEIRVPISESTLPGSCAHYMATLSIPDVRSDIRYKRVAKKGQQIHQDPLNMLLAPLAQNGELLGVIKVINSKHGKFNDEDIRFLEVVSMQLAASLRNVELFEELQTQFLQVCEALGEAISKKDKYTGGHTKRVSFFAEMIAREMNLTSKEMMELRLAAALHDIGKIGIADQILKKQAPLTEEEFAVMKDHPRFGYEILSNIDSLKNVVDGMRYHHERPDGQGYPYGLKGDEIPLIAQVISVADTFDAMISTRPYRKGLPPMVAYEEILAHSGTQFSETVVKAFKKGFEKSSMYRPGETTNEDKEKLLAHKKRVAGGGY